MATLTKTTYQRYGRALDITGGSPELASGADSTIRRGRLGSRAPQNAHFSAVGLATGALQDGQRVAFPSDVAGMRRKPSARRTRFAMIAGSLRVSFRVATTRERSWGS